MGYDELLIEADTAGLIVKEKPLQAHDGLINGKRIAIRRDLPSQVQKTCVLAEELGHYHTTAGDILDQANVANRKQEHKARCWAFDLLATPRGLIECYLAGCRNRYEIAEHLGVTEEFLDEALRAYRQKYGAYVRYENYVIMLEPCLGVLDMLEN